MNDKIARVLKYNNGTYSFDSVSEIINDNNTIEVTNSNYNALLDGKSTNVKGSNIDTNKDIQLVFNQREIYSVATKNGMNDLEAKNAIKEVMNRICETMVEGKRKYYQLKDEDF